MEEYIAVQEVIDRLKAFGAEVETDALDWLQKSFGDFAELTETILAIQLHDAVTGDEFVEYLVSEHEKLLGFRSLDLAAAAYPTLLSGSSAFFDAQGVNLNRTPITWEALHIVQWLPELETVHVEGTGLSWLTRHKLAAQLRHNQKSAAALRAVHPTMVR